MYLSSSIIYRKHKKILKFQIVKYLCRTWNTHPVNLSCRCATHTFQLAIKWFTQRVSHWEFRELNPQ